LLNDQISFTQGTLVARYGNPYPIEDKLLKLFKAFPHLIIELVSDACREKLEYSSVFKGLQGIPRPPMGFMILNTELRPYPNPSNTFFLRIYACQKHELTDGLSEFSRQYVSFVNTRLDKGKYASPTMFSKFNYENTSSKSLTDVAIKWKDQVYGHEQVVLIRPMVAWIEEEETKQPA
jgi:hypothetical protein